MTEKNAESGVALTLVDDKSTFLVAEDSSMIEMLAETMDQVGPDALDLKRIAVPAAANTTWTVPTVTGEQETKELHVIVFHIQGRRKKWFATTYDESGGGEAPRCQSVDGVTGFGVNVLEDGVKPSEHECSACPWNQFGSRGAGKACADYTTLWVMLPGAGLPYELNVPAMSIKPWASYQIDLNGLHCRPRDVVTSLKLRKERSKSGKLYAELEPTMLRKLTADEKEKMLASLDALTKTVTDFSEGRTARGRMMAEIEGDPGSEPVVDVETA